MESLDYLIKNKIILPYEEELMYILRSYNLNHIPLSIWLSSVVLCNKKCHLMAIYLTLGLKDFKYINGNINRYLHTDIPNHSWVEHDGYVYDPTECIKYKTDYYYKKFNAEVIEEFDDQSIKDYSLYQTAIKKIDTDEYIDNNILLLLQSLEYLEEKVKHTSSGEILRQEIKKYKEEFDIDTKFSDLEVQKYILSLKL